MCKQLFTTLSICIGFINAMAQPNEQGLGSWNIVNARLNLNQRWNVFLEPQLRSLQFYNNFHYYEVKGGLGYRINETFSLTGSLGTYQTFSEGGNFKQPVQQDEIRSWFQFAMRNQLGRVRFEHRYRAEQRFTQLGYRNRLRYRLNTVIPINGSEIKAGTFYATLWNELFLTDREPYFERNRFFVGVGYEITKKCAVQTGYIHQYDYRLTDETGRDFLQVSLLFNFDLKDLKREFVPNTLN
jgi:hypothetical protein